MDIIKFLEKYNLSNNKYLDSTQIASFLAVLDYFYCIGEKDKLIQLISDFYDNANEIYNSAREIAIKTKKD